MRVNVPEGLNWLLWGILTHKRNRATLHEIETHWSLDDLLDAHLALQVHDTAEILAANRSQEMRAR